MASNSAMSGMSGMDMSTTTTAIASSTASMVMSSMSGMSGMATPTSAAAMASSTADSMGGMDMGMGMGGGGGHACKISMLWNWYTVDSCFLSSTWHIRSHGMFAGSCIGVVILVILLEGLRRAAGEYDAYIVRQLTAQKNSLPNPSATALLATSTKEPNAMIKASPPASSNEAMERRQRRGPNVFEQTVRAALHMAQFAVAYFIMLLAMYFNGYIIICIFIGAFLGFFIFGWRNLVGKGEEEQREVTFCCG